VSNEQPAGRTAVYPGSFDPLTNGHLDIARRGARLFDKLIIAPYANPAKDPLFTLDERITLWQEIIRAEELSNVEVVGFSNELLVDFVRSVGGQAIIKGLRSSADFEDEFQQGLMNRKLAPEIDTICLFTNLEQLIVRSSLLKQVARLGGDVSDMLPGIVVQALQQKFNV
jgi:pantetheine-phosphate adenylyltransferase